MSTIAVLTSGENGADSLTDINNNFSNLNADKAELASPTFTGTVTTPTANVSGLTASEIVATDGTKNLQSLAVATYPSLTELSYVKGVTSALQTQINAKGAGTVTAVSVASANGVSGSSSGGATPALTIALGAITPSTVNGNTLTTGTGTITISGTKTLTVSDTATVSGTNTGDNTVATALTGTPSITVATVTTTGNIELGHASDTTLARGSAGVVTIEGSNVLTAATGLPLSGGTMTGNITLGENTSVALDPAGSADGKYTGLTITGTAGATLAFGDLIYLDPTDSRWELADANAAAAADGDSRGILGICVLAAGADGNATTILLNGVVRADTAFPALTINAPVYVGETAGDIVVTQPTTASVVIRAVGFALTADEIYFNPDPGYITHA